MEDVERLCDELLDFREAMRIGGPCQLDCQNCDLKGRFYFGDRERGACALDVVIDYVWERGKLWMAGYEQPGWTQDGEFPGS